MGIIDAWMQHPSARLLPDPMSGSLRRWAHGQLAGDEDPVEATVAAMDAAGVQAGMLCAWWGPRGPHGRRQVLSGSSHPAWPAADCLEDFASLQLDDEAASMFLHGNADRIFGLAGKPGPTDPRQPS